MNQAQTAADASAGTGRQLRTWLLVAAIAAIGVGASIAGAFLVQRVKIEHAENDFRLKAQERIAAVRRDVEVQLESLHALGSLFDSSQHVDEEEFRTFASGALARHPGLVGLAYARRVPAAELETAEVALGSPITDVGPDGQPVPRTERDTYFPFWYVVTRDGVTVPLGLDLLSNPQRAAALQRTLQSGRIEVTEPVPLLTRPRTLIGVIGIKALYRRTDGAPRGTPYGAVLSAVAAENVIDSAIASIGSGGVDLHVHDVGAKITPLYLHSETDPATAAHHNPTHTHPDPVITVTEEIGGRRWVITAAPSMPLSANSAEALAVLGAGLLVTLLAATSVATTISRRDAARLVRDRTAALAAEIEEHKRVQARLAESELRFRQLADNVDAVFWMTSVEQYRADYVSPAFERIWGRPAADLLRDTSVFFAALHPDDRQRVESLIATQGTVAYDIEYRIVRPDGSVRWIRDRSVPIPPGPQGARAAGIAEDITERRAAAMALQRSEERLRRVFEAVVDPVWEWEVQGDRTVFSPSWQTLLGYERAQIDASLQTWDTLLHPDDRDRVWAVINDALAGARPDYEAEYRLRTSDGTYKWVLSRGRVVERDEAGRGTRMIGSITDITARKRAEEALRESEARQRAVLAAIPDCMFRMRRDGTYLDYHAPDGMPLMAKPEEFLGRRCADVVPLYVARPTLEAIDDALRTGEVRTFEYSGRGEPTRRWEVRIAPCGAEEALAIVRDVSEQRRAEEALRASEELNRRIVEALPGGLVMITPDGSIRQANSEAESFLGLSWDELSRRHVVDFQHETIREDGSPFPPEEYPVSRCLRTGRSQPPATIGIRRRDGSTVWGVFTAVPLLGGSGSPEGAVVTFLDITARRAVEEALRASEERYRLLFDANPQPMWVYDTATLRFLAVNSAAVSAYGYTHDEFLAMTIEDIRPPEDIDRLHRAIRERAASHHSYAGLWRHRRKNGEIIDADIVSHDVTFGAAPTRLVLATDVTQARRNEAQRLLAEQALRASEERYRTIAEQTGQLIYDYHISSGSVVWAGAIAALTGYTPEEFARVDVHDWEQLIHPADRAPVLDELRRVTRDGGHFTMEYRFRRKDGLYARILDNGVVIPSHAGDPTDRRMLGAMQDITERAAAAAALRDSEERYRLLAENATDMISRLTPDGRFLYASPASRSLLGYEPRDLFGRSAFELLDEGDAPAAQRKHDALLGGLDSETLRYRLRHSSGETVWIETTERAVRDPESGAVTEIVAVSRDITARMDADRALRASEERFRSLSTCSPIGIFMCTSAGEVNWTNPRLQEIAGFTFDDALGTGWVRRLHPGDAPWIRQGWDRAAAAARPFSAELRFQHEDGVIRWARATTAPMFSDSGELIGHVGAVEDITERKLAEQALSESEERYRRLVETSPDGILVHQNERVVFSNAAADRLLGAQRPGELIGVGVLELVHESNAPDVRRRLQLLREGAPTVPSLDQRLIRRDGTLFDAEVLGSSCMYAGHQAVQVVIRDVTARKAAEARLRFQASVLSQVDDAVIAQDDQLRITYLNAAAARAYDADPTEVLGRPASELFSQQWLRPGDEDAARAALRRAGRWEGQSIHIMRSGQRIYVESAVSILRDEHGRDAGTLAVIRDVTDRIRWEQRQSLMMAELDHRVKNNLAAVLSIADQTIRSSGSLEDFSESFTGRIRALARMHGVLAQSRWKGAGLADLARQSLEAFMIGASQRVFIHGPDVLLPARAASPVCMALHELATNAAKYGALSVAGGRVDVRWELTGAPGHDGPPAVNPGESSTIDTAANGSGANGAAAATATPRGDTTPSVSLRWEESGGPPVKEPGRRGFGTELIQGGIAYELHGTVGITFRPEGLICEMNIPLLDEPDRLEPPPDNGTTR